LTVDAPWDAEQVHELLAAAVDGYRRVGMRPHVEMAEHVIQSTVSVAGVAKEHHFRVGTKPSS
jgi:hypothetical protein